MRIAAHPFVDIAILYISHLEIGRSQMGNAQTILLHSGAISYSIHHLLHRHQEGRDLLQMMSVQHKESLESLLEEQVEPVRQLFLSVRQLFLSVNETRMVVE